MAINLAEWRAKLGVLVPSSNTTMEPELYQIAPEGVSIHFSRIRQKDTTIEELRRMAQDVPRAAAELADAKVDLVAFGCTSGSLVGGRSYDEELVRKIENSIHIPAITTASAVVSGMKSLNIHTVCVGTPFEHEVNEKTREFLESHGFKVLNVKGLACPDEEVANLSMAQVYKLAKEAFTSRADGLFLSCTDLRTIDIIEALEHDLGRPVISSNQATMWMMLRKVGIEEAIDRCGALLAK